jgi:hypothetical protein
MHRDGGPSVRSAAAPTSDRGSRPTAHVVYVYDDEGRQQLRVRTIDGRKDRR